MAYIVIKDIGARNGGKILGDHSLAEGLSTCERRYPIAKAEASVPIP
jgi:hypothetical protein